MDRRLLIVLGIVALAALVAVPFFPQVIYPVFVMRVMCLALFACAFNILLGHTGILSFGHAAFFGGAAYFCGLTMLKGTGACRPEIGILTRDHFCQRWSGASVSAALATCAGRASSGDDHDWRLDPQLVLLSCSRACPGPNSEDACSRSRAGVLFGV